MYLLKSKLSHLYIMDKNGLMTSKQEKALSFIDEASGKLYMAKHGFSQQYYELFYSKPNEKDMKDDLINHPNHYNSYSFEVVDVIDEVVPHYPASYSGHIQNAIKYIFRAPFKGTLRDDLKKAVWYLNHAIDIIDKDN